MIVKYQTIINLYLLVTMYWRMHWSLSYIGIDSKVHLLFDSYTDIKFGSHSSVCILIWKLNIFIQSSYFSKIRLLELLELVKIRGEFVKVAFCGSACWLGQIITTKDNWKYKCVRGKIGFLSMIMCQHTSQLKIQKIWNTLLNWYYHLLNCLAKETFYCWKTNNI